MNGQTDELEGLEWQVFEVHAGWSKWMICAHGSQAWLLWWYRCLNLKYFVNIILMICCEFVGLKYFWQEFLKLILATIEAQWKYHRDPVCPDEVQWQWQVVFHKLCYSQNGNYVGKKTFIDKTTMDQDTKIWLCLHNRCLWGEQTSSCTIQYELYM